MAKESMKAREVKRAKLVAKYAQKRAELKKIVNTGESRGRFRSRTEAPGTSQECLYSAPPQPLQHNRTSQRLHAPVRHLAVSSSAKWPPQV